MFGIRIAESDFMRYVARQLAARTLHRSPGL